MSTWWNEYIKWVYDETSILNEYMMKQVYLSTPQIYFDVARVPINTAKWSLWLIR